MSVMEDVDVLKVCKVSVRVSEYLVAKGVRMRSPLYSIVHLRAFSFDTGSYMQYLNRFFLNT